MKDWMAGVGVGVIGGMGAIKDVSAISKLAMNARKSPQFKTVVGEAEMRLKKSFKTAKEIFCQFKI